MKSKMTLLIICMSFFASFHLTAQVPGFEWAVQTGGDSLIQATSVAVDAAGNQVIIGSFRETVDFDPSLTEIHNLTAKGYSDIFIQKLDANGAFLWAASIGDTFNMNERGSEVVTDAAGNIYATGYFWGTTDVDPGDAEVILSQNRWTTMVLKINPDGDLIWGKQMGSETAGHAYGWSIAVDNNGNVITSGYFYGRVDFDPGPGVVNLTCTSNDIFIQKLDQNGNFIWVKQIIGTDYKYPYSMVTDAGGNLYTCGYFKGTVDFNPDRKLKNNLTSYGDYDIFVLKLTGNGDFGYAKQIGGTGQDISYSIALDPAGYLYTTGQFYGTADFDPGTGTSNLTSFGGNDAYVLKLDLSGNFVWVKQIGGLSYQSGGDIILDGDGYFYVSGYFYSTVDFDPGTGTYYLTANGNDDSFVFKSDLNGDLQWAIQAGGPGFDYCMSMAVDASGNIFNVGSFEETADFDPDGNVEFELTNTGVRDMFVQKLNPAGGDNCVAPIGLAATNITETSANLSWNSVDGAEGYYVRYRETFSEWVYSDLLTDLNLLIEGLNPLSANEFQVKTDCESNFSYSHEFLTLGPGCPDNYEPNETMGTAVPIPVNNDITALIPTSVDKDWFKFSTSGAAKNVHITLTSLPANYNIILYKSDGTVLATSLNPDLEDESIVYNTTKIGTYYILAYGYAGVYDPADCYLLHVATSSSSYPKSAEANLQPDTENAKLSIYPNPAREILNVDFNTSTVGNTNISIMSPEGKVVFAKEYQSSPGSNHITVPVNELKAGLYLVRLTSVDGVLTRKIMINK
jgi:hypothetical protein